MSTVMKDLIPGLKAAVRAVQERMALKAAMRESISLSIGKTPPPTFEEEVATLTVMNSLALIELLKKLEG